MRKSKKHNKKWNKNIGDGVSKMTDINIEKLKRAFSIDATIKEACFYAEISESTYYSWVKNNPKLSEEFERLRNNPVLTARQNLVKSLTDPKYALEYLKRKCRNEFGDFSKVEHAGSVELIANPVAMSEDEKKALDLFRQARRKRIEAESDKLE